MVAIIISCIVLVFLGWLLYDWKDGNAGQGEPPRDHEP